MNEEQAAEHTFKTSRRSAKRRHVRDIQCIHKSREGEFGIAMAPASGGGLFILEGVDVFAQIPALPLAFGHFLSLPYHSQLSATKAAVCWWLNSADSIVSLRDAMPRRHLVTDEGQQIIWQAHLPRVDILYPIDLALDGPAPMDIRALIEIGKVEMDEGVRIRDLTLVHRLPLVAGPREVELSVVADVFDLQFPALAHAYGQWFGTDDAMALYGAIEWWIANAEELRNRGSVCAAIGMCAADVGAFVWHAHHSAKYDPIKHSLLPPLSEYDN